MKTYITGLIILCLACCFSCSSDESGGSNQTKYVIADWESGSYSNIIQSDASSNSISSQAGTGSTITSSNIFTGDDQYAYFAGTFLRNGSAVIGYNIHTYSAATTTGTSFAGADTLQFDYLYSGETDAKVYICLATGDTAYKDMYTDINTNTVTLTNDNAWHTISIPLTSGFSSSSSSALADIIDDIGLVIIMIYSADSSAPTTDATITKFAIDDVILRN